MTLCPAFDVFLRSARGSVAPAFAVAATVLLGVAGAAIDYTRNTNSRANLQAAADAAALAAVATALDRRALGDSVATAKATAQNQAMQAWQTEIADLADAQAAPPAISLTESNSVWTAKLDYTANMQTSISAVLGIADMEIAGTATATNASLSTSVNSTDYYDFTFLADISASMGIGATQSIRQAMIAHPKIGCDFACHITYVQPPINPYNEARSAGFTLRIDKVDEAIDSAIDKLGSMPSPSRFRAALYGMDTQLVTYQAMTANLVGVKNKTVDIRPVTGGQGYTWGKKVLNQVKSRIGVSGDGSSQAQAKKVLVLISDGIENYSHPVSGYHNTAGYSHWTNGITVARCDAIKASGVIIVTLQIDFIQEYGPANYAAIVQPIEHLIEPNMQACATSPDHYRSVDDASGIAAALDDLVDEVFISTNSGDTRLTH